MLRAVLVGLLLAALVPVLVGSPPQATAAERCPAGHIALTFDDGPSALHTPRILDILADRSVHATFFVVGSSVDSRPALVRRAGADGHVVANHTYRHEQLTSLSNDAIVRTVDATDRAIRNAGATPTRLVRPPYGATSSRVRTTLANAGYGHILWTIDPRDWESSASATVRHVLANLRNGSVVLLHDGVRNSSQTVTALPAIIDGARSKGFCFARLDARGRLVADDVPYDWRLAGGPFRDVPPTSTHAEAIDRIAELGITQGCDADHYCPDDPVTRAQMASFLQRALELPPGPVDAYRDVGTGSVHARAIGALGEAGITRGCDPDGLYFCPNECIRRDQMASFLARGFALEPGPVDLFVDVAPTSTHASAIGAVAEVGITRGCSQDGRSYCPGEDVTRAQMASFLIRALDHAG